MASEHTPIQRSDDESNEAEGEDYGDDNGERLHVRDGLCESVLAALLEFQHGGGGFNNDSDDDGGGIISRDGICAANQPEDTDVIAATLRRLKEQDRQVESNERKERVVEPLLVDASRSNWTVLEQDGVVRIDNVLSHELCAACLDYINQALLVGVADHLGRTASTNDGESAGDYGGSKGFGNVFERNNRCDMYLRNTGVIEEALHHMLNLSAPLGALFRKSLGGEPADFHELSSLVADPGCVAQPIHPDAKYSTNTNGGSDTVPLWTCFIALQTVQSHMGGTVFLPGTHTAASHALLTSNAPGGAIERKLWLQNDCTYRRADLQVGDCAVMDARTLHYGGANTKPLSTRKDDEVANHPQRRILLYFTIRNPLHTSGYPPCGSLYADLDGILTTKSYIQ
jgi:Phytanoyl-CoA dioxygenase (PhyH)